MFTLIVLFLLPCSTHYQIIFVFFWNHEEKTNFIAYDKVKFSENFLIQEFLNQYISIVFTISIYFFFLLLIIKKSQNKYWLALPFFGLLILIINSFGFPSKNFDPLTGDLFKVHYYSFFCNIFLCSDSTFFIQTKDGQITNFDSDTNILIFYWISQKY